MRSLITILVLLGGWLSSVLSAQVYLVPSAPELTARQPPVVVAGEPLLHEGQWYAPSGPDVFYDPQMMVPVAAEPGQLLFVNRTLEPNRAVFVPVSRYLLRPYIRIPADRAATLGPRIAQDVPSSSAIQPAAAAVIALPSTFAPTNEAVPVGATGRGPQTGSEALQPVGTSGVAERQRARRAEQPVPAGRLGVWIEFEGQRWNSAGRAVPHVDGRFVRIGSRLGVPVYQDAAGTSDQIFMPTVEGGMLTPFRRR